MFNESLYTPSPNHEPSTELHQFVRVCVQTFIKQANFFTTSSWWHDITSSEVLSLSDHFLFFWNLNAMALHACVQAMTAISLKIPFNLLHIELTRTQVHKYDFSNRYG